MTEPVKFDQVMEHDSDGIQEYDNPSPGWWLYTFYFSIVFAVLYMIFYALQAGDGQTGEYQAEMIRETTAVQDYFALHPMVPPDSTELLAAAVNPEVLAAGKERFLKTCAPCHGEQAQGLIGPNLTDKNWIHGGKITEIWTTIVKGVAAKGMPPWGRAFKPEELSALAAYVRSVQGTNPANPKAAEGEPVDMEALPGTTDPLTPQAPVEPTPATGSPTVVPVPPQPEQTL